MDLDFYVFDNYRDLINDFNSIIIDIHCKLANKNLDLNGLLKIQCDLIALNKTSLEFKSFFLNVVEPAFKEEAEKMRTSMWSDKRNVRIVYDFLDEIETGIRILFGNINRRKSFLNKRLLENLYNCSIDYCPENSLIYYDANEKIIEYLDNDDYDISKIDVHTEFAMVLLLQRQLGSSSNDLNELLEMFKDKNNDNLSLKLEKN